MSRLHPFDLAFGEAAETGLAGIHAAHAGALDRRRFLQLESVQRLLDEFGPQADTPLQAALMEEFGVLLYAAYHFWAAGRVTVDVSLESVERAAGGEDHTRELPTGAWYLRLPEHRMWAQIAPDAPHEPLDGVFLVSPPAAGDLTVVAVLGLRPDRPGFSQIAVTAAREDLAAAGAHRPGRLFAPVMEGGERAGFRSVTTEGELVYLARLAAGQMAGSR
ncbi:MAG TPA: hypothetical protein VD793_02985 [Gemmatimonadales bacterium]|nr:hypothetical protein [Gemmatimonadales bacterium]